MLYRSVWSKPLTIPLDIGPDTLLNQGEVCKMLGVDPSTLRRALNRGEGPPEAPGSHLGVQRWFVAWEVVTWRGTFTGESPRTREEAVAWWPEVEPRTNPAMRPAWWQRGERRYEYFHRKRSKFGIGLLLIEAMLKLPETEGGDRTRNWLIEELRNLRE